MNETIANLLETGSKHGMALPERQLLEKALLAAGLADEVHCWRRTTAFVNYEAMLSAEVVAGFLRAIVQGGLDGAVATQHLAGLGWNAPTRDDPALRSEPSPGYGRVAPPPRTPRRKAVPLGADLTPIRKQFPTAQGFELFGQMAPGAKHCLVSFRDGSGKQRTRRCAIRKAAPTTKPKAMVPDGFAFPPAKKPVPPAPAPRPLTFREQWQNDSTLQFEFVSADAFHFYMTAKSNGLIRHYSK